MKYRLTLVFLLSLLFGSFSFNCLHYDALVKAEKINQIDRDMYSKMIAISYNRNEQ
jgi:hypothetical protein